jgi:hypothetical protein
MAAITTLATLKAAVSDYYPDGPRTDITSSLLTDFLKFTQDKMYYGDTTHAPLRIRQMVSSATITPSSAGVTVISSAVSSSWLEFLELTPTYTNAQSLNFVEPWAFRKEVSLLSSTVAPAFIYTIEGDNLITAPGNTSTITAVYYAKFTAMSADGDADWIVLNRPQLYLDGMLAEACAYFGGPEESAFRAKFAAGITALNKNDRLARSSGAVLRSRVRVVV